MTLGNLSVKMRLDPENWFLVGYIPIAEVPQNVSKDNAAELRQDLYVKSFDLILSKFKDVSARFEKRERERGEERRGENNNKL